MKTMCSVCFVVGSMLLLLATCIVSSETLPGIHAPGDVIGKTVAGAFGPCQNGGTGECKVVGSQSVCNGDNIGLTCGTSYGQIDRVCTNNNPEMACAPVMDFCTNYKKCENNYKYGYQCNDGGPAAYSWKNCILY